MGEHLAVTRPGWLAATRTALPGKLERGSALGDVQLKYLTAKQSGINPPCGVCRMNCTEDNECGSAQPGKNNFNVKVNSNPESNNLNFV